MKTKKRFEEEKISIHYGFPWTFYMTMNGLWFDYLWIENQVLEIILKLFSFIWSIFGFNSILICAWEKETKRRLKEK